MPKSGQEVVCEGWLTKSPPTKRIWRARWRKRWFCLQNSGELPGQYCLTYYTDRKCRKLKGSINLDLCEQVDSGLKFEDNKYKFDYMFDIKTPMRTYYLAAETEEEMKAWVTCICNICGLKTTTDDETVTRSLNAPTIYEECQSEEHEETIKNAVDSPPVSPVSSGPYIPISECITGRLPSQGVQDFYTLLQHNIKNSYFRSAEVTKSHNNETYDTAPSSTYLNDINSEDHPRFYDLPRQLQPPHTLRKTYKNSDTYSNAIKLEKNNSPLQSPTDSENVFTDDDWTTNISFDNMKSGNISNSSMTEPLIMEPFSKITLDSTGKTLDPPPRPPKPMVSASPSNFNLFQANAVLKTSKDIDANPADEVFNLKNHIQGISDEMYDFPRSHQLESESVSSTLMRRHCYNNAAPVKIEGQIFRYDISPKPSTSAAQVFQYDNIDVQDEPASPLSQGSSSTTAMYSNLPSPLLTSDNQLMPPPQINRSLKPKRKLSDSLSVSSSTEPSSPHLAPSVDRSCKPAVSTQSAGLRKAFESDGEYSRRQRAAPSPTPPQDNLYGNQQMCSFLSSVQYLDLDHSTSEYGTTTPKTQPLRSPGATTVYKQVDFMKTQAFNITRIHVEKERKGSVSSFKK